MTVDLTNIPENTILRLANGSIAVTVAAPRKGRIQVRYLGFLHCGYTGTPDELVGYYDFVQQNEIESVLGIWPL